VSEQTPSVEARIPAALRPPIEAELARAVQEHVSERLRRGDPELWGAPGEAEIADRVGWLTIAERMLGELDAVEAFALEIRDAGFEHVVLLGMGGSSLAPEVLRRSFGHVPGRPRLHVLDSTDAAAIRAVQEAVEPQRTLFVVSSKSGGTIEPLSLLAHFSTLVGDGAHFIAITDPGSGLAELASERGFRHVFLGDPDIGGRYSALSPFGIVPAALMGVDVRSLLEGAAAAWTTALVDAETPRSSSATDPLTEHDALPAPVWLGAALAALARSGRDKLTFVIAESLPGLGLWLEQLVAESTGKHATGILPVAEEPLGDPSVYGEDRVFAYLSDVDRPDPALDARVAELAAAGHPVFELPTGGAEDLGRLFLLWELAVAVAGWGLQINPFDQPNVQQAKDATNRVLGEYERDHELPAVAEAASDAVEALLLGAAPPDYVAIMAYAAPSAELDAAIAQLRSVVRGARKATTTFGYGPRFLHSTGQFHKGGPRSGRFLQLVHDAAPDVDIPNAAYTFTTLKNAQAIGDLTTLQQLGLPAEHMRLAGTDAAGAVRALSAAVAAAGEASAGDHANQQSRPQAG
jgi:glucose-6-phosphate isomerase